ncbi:restriction endonuclease [Aristaeella hokkaidonensis]|uniref:Restriction endonuclease n=1 Tax=Aristaeella hokkaidonensis TaxID=3046382 RepID=A0AC61MUR7_9FIRM|nr:restriction endonuclease [Aristaeella hokkaidonensis]QUC66114.1 restriction endonuclease [Aristaeella hokkaidonensis]SNT94883.1 restriction system protein [Aristaeella hokkaidonensis]
MSNIDEKWLWGIHTYDDNLFLNEGVIAIGWKEFGDISRFPADREAIKKEYALTYPNDPKGSIPTCAGMLYRFCFEVKDGDYVVYPSKIDRMINIGIVQGSYFYDSAEDVYPQKHNIKWIKKLPRTAFSQGALYEVGSALAFFTVKNYADEFIAALDNDFVKKNKSEKIDPTVGATAEEIIQSTRDFILKELSSKLKGYDLEDFIADLLNAMGYRTSVSQHGGDSGIDIIAYKDELPPRIAVQVKSQDSDIKETTIQSLKGAMMPGDYGLFVTLSNYTKNAQVFLKANPIIRGINGVELVDLILKYYDQLSEKYQKIIPLKKVYIPVSSNND